MMKGLSSALRRSFKLSTKREEGDEEEEEEEEDDDQGRNLLSKSSSMLAASSLGGKWERYSSTREEDSIIVSPLPLLSDVQDIKVDGNQLVFSSGDRTKLELCFGDENENETESEIENENDESEIETENVNDIKDDKNNDNNTNNFLEQETKLKQNKIMNNNVNNKKKKIRCSCGGDGVPLRLEYDCDQGKIIDERRIFRNGTRLEQKLLMVPYSHSEGSPPIIERRYFRRRSSAMAVAISLIEQQKVRLLVYLLLSQVPLIWLVPSRLHGVFVCTFHMIALALILFWSPSKHEEEEEPFHPEDDRHYEHTIVGVESNHKSHNSNSKLLQQQQQQQQQPVMIRRTSSLISNRDYITDVCVLIDQWATRRKRFSKYSEYRLIVKTIPQDKLIQSRQWVVWYSYSSILAFHNLLQQILETKSSSRSLFTRVVPDIPPPRSSSVRFMSKKSHADMQRRRMAGLQEFFLQLFGPDSDLKVRHKALADVRVQKFLKINTN